MLFKSDKSSYQVTEIDLVEKTKTSWNHWRRWEQICTPEKLTDAEIIEYLENAIRRNTVVTVDECDSMPESGSSLETVDYL